MTICTLPNTEVTSEVQWDTVKVQRAVVTGNWALNVTRGMAATGIVNHPFVMNSDDFRAIRRAWSL